MTSFHSLKIWAQNLLGLIVGIGEWTEMSLSHIVRLGESTQSLGISLAKVRTVRLVNHVGYKVTQSVATRSSSESFLSFGPSFGWKRPTFLLTLLNMLVDHTMVQEIQGRHALLVSPAYVSLG